MSRKAYDDIEAMNWSSLRHLADSPLAFRWWTEHERPDSAAMLLGRAIHCAVLEPEKFAECYYALPPRPADADGRGKKDSLGKLAYEAWKAACADAAKPGAEELTASEMATVERVQRAIAGHAAASAIVTVPRTEVTLEWTDEESGVACKARLDALGDGGIADLKTTHKPLTPALVAAEVARRMYHGQLAYYHDGAIAAGKLPRDAAPPVIVVAQTVAPYDVAVFHLDAYALEAGRALYRSLLRRYVECKATDWWPGSAPDPVPLSLPAWAPGMAEAVSPDPEWISEDES